MTAKSTSSTILLLTKGGHSTEGLREILERENFVVTEAQSMSHAESILLKMGVDLLLIDHSTADNDNLKFLNKIRKYEQYTSCIFLTKDNTPETMKTILDSGADDCLEIPFNHIELLARIRSRLHFKRIHNKFREANHHLKELSETDDVTKLFNMRSMYQRITYVLKQAVRYQRRVSCLMLDIDFFKQANDSHDHIFGSFVLKELGTIIKKTIRDTDFAARYGGDEFLIVLTETTADGAELFAERLRKETAKHLFKDEKESMKITLSIGLAVSPLEEKIDAKNLVRRADIALYKAKESGRNKVCVFDRDFK